MSLLLVVVLLFFSSSCSVSSGQYYVSDDCSSVTQSPCNPLSVYAGNMSQYNNTIFYFIGTTTIKNNVYMTAVKNVTLHGLDQSPSIHGNEEVYNINGVIISLHYSDHVTVSSLSFSDCTVEINSSNNITVTNSVFTVRSNLPSLNTVNAFDLKISSSVFFTDFTVGIWYQPLPVCSDELLHYSLTLTNLTFTTGSAIVLHMNHGTTYNVSVIFDHVQSSTNHHFILVGGLFYFFIISSSFHGVTDSSGFYIKFLQNTESSYDCTYPGTQLTSTYVLEDSQFYNNKQGLKILGNKYLLKAVNHHIIIKSCLIYDNINEGLFIDGTFLRLTQIDIIDTQLIGNGGNKIMNNNAPISLSNVTVANSTYTGLTLERSLVTINNNLIFRNNTGVVGGGLAINDSSGLILSSSANLEFIDNHASYKGGGIYLEESSDTDIKFMTPNIPLTLINNSAGLVGGDLYGVYRMTHSNQFNLTNRNISSTSIPWYIRFCDPHTTTSFNNCLYNVSDQHIYPGQALKFNVALFGFNYFESQTLTDGTVAMHNYAYWLNQTHIPNICSLIEYTPKLIPTSHQKYKIYLAVFNFGTSFGTNIFSYFTVSECPIGFRRYGKISRLMGSHAVPVLSTLTFLSYTKLVRTIVIVLHKREVTLHCTNESVRSVSLWYEDPNVEYAKGKHTGLFGFALLVTVFFVIPYTLFLLFNHFYEKYLSNFKVFKKFWSRFKPIIDAYSGPMKDEYRFWPGLLLVARIPVLLTVTFLKNESRVLLLAVAAFILSLSFIFGGVYRKKLNNIIEFWFLLNLCIMASLSIAFTDESKLSHMKCYDALIKKLFKKQDEDDEPLLDVTESHLTVDEQRRAMVPSSTDVRRCASRESVVELY
uniref:Right handed beta helix domain-containing protein n=1 Tax=Amphimedon queenslandica TaxID=400682 RepID=A0A1X7TBL9_AMPQE